jgi:hypothetical protein
MWALYLTAARLQQAADTAVLPGAGYLPIVVRYDAHYAVYKPIVLKLVPLRGAALAGTRRPSAMGVGNGCASAHDFAALWITSIDAKSSINARFLDCVSNDELLRKERGDGTLGWVSL